MVAGREEGVQGARAQGRRNTRTVKNYGEERRWRKEQRR